MRKLILVAALLMSSGAVLFPPSGAQAAETRFMCGDEAAINSIAAKLVVNQEDADLVATPFLTKGVCKYLPNDVHIDVVYHGKVYSKNLKFVVEVVGFMDASNTHMFYGMMQKDVLTI